MNRPPLLAESTSVLSNVHFVTLWVTDIDRHDPISFYHCMPFLLRIVAYPLHPNARGYANGSLTNFIDNFSESEGAMLQTDITILQQRQKVLEKEIDEALSHAPIDDPMIAYLKSRILYVKEELDRLRDEAFISYH